MSLNGEMLEKVDNFKNLGSNTNFKMKHSKSTIIHSSSMITHFIHIKLAKNHSVTVVKALFFILNKLEPNFIWHRI